MIGNSVIMELIANGVHWHYQSYDHKAAVAEMKQSHTSSPFEDLDFFTNFVPDELKEKYPEWKTGKLRSMRFDPDGMIERMYIGRSSKYCKRFFPQQVGIEVKPILNKNDDKFGLIQAGLAVDESQLNL